MFLIDPVFLFDSTVLLTDSSCCPGSVLARRRWSQLGWTSLSHSTPVFCFSLCIWFPEGEHLQFTLFLIQLDITIWSLLVLFSHLNSVVTLTLAPLFETVLVAICGSSLPLWFFWFSTDSFVSSSPLSDTFTGT